MFSCDGNIKKTLNSYVRFVNKEEDDFEVWHKHGGISLYTCDGGLIICRNSGDYMTIVYNL